jgi:hypothetical protein
MELKEVYKSLEHYHKGTFIRVEYEKKYSHGCTCRTAINTRLGCKYERLATTSPATTFTKADYAKPIDGDKIVYENLKNGTLYIQHEPMRVAKCESRATRWYKNGIEVSEAEARANLPKSAFDVQRTGIKRIKLDNIISIGG